MKKLLAIILCVISGITTCCFASCGQTKTGFSVYAPDGAPALAIAKFIKDDENFGSDKPFSYNVVSATEINNAILTESADFVIMPLNAATKLYKENGKEDYKMAAVITHGNFYIMGKTELTSIDDLVGKVICVPQRGKVPDWTFLSALKNLNIEYVEGDVATAGIITVNYTYQNAADIVRLLIQGSVEFGLIPEPAATNLSSKGVGYQLSLQELFDAENKSYPQAVLMVKKSVAENYLSIVNEMANAFATNVEWVINNPADAVEIIKTKFEITTLNPATLSSSAIYNCKIYWQGSASAKSVVNAYIERVRGVNPASANLVDDSFFM